MHSLRNHDGALKILAIRTARREGGRSKSRWASQKVNYLILELPPLNFVMSLSREPRCGPPGKMQSEQSGVPTRVQTSSKGSRLPFLATTGNSASEYPSIPFAPDLNNLIYHRRHFRIIKQSCSFSRNGRKHDLSRVYISL